jgi:hypothetical protein
MRGPRARYRSLFGVALATVLVGAGLSTAASPGPMPAGQRLSVVPAQFDSDPPDVEFENLPYNGAFTFARVRFRPAQWGPSRRYAWGLDLKWNHDYPRADRRLPEILTEVTGIEANIDGSSIVDVGDPDLFNYPWTYMCEVGFLTLDDAEAENLRAYLMKGGFMVIDDFVSYHWYNFEDQMRRVFPDLQWIELYEDHPIFNAFFEIEDLSFGGGQYLGYQGGGSPRYFGLFEDNDPNGRMMMIVNFDNDIGEYWEFADSPYVAIALTNEAFKLGVNYVVYSTLH